MASNGVRRGPILALVLLLALGAAGAYNYDRNLRREPPRPYRDYDAAELATLIGAYEQEIESLAARRAGAEGGVASPAEGALLSDRVREFQRARSAGEAARRHAGEIAQQEAILRELRREQQLRSGGFRLHLQRLLGM